MNANELADELEMLQVAQYGDRELCVAPTKIHKEAATMLRQQQAEIEALKKELNARFEAGKALGYAEGLASMSGMTMKGAGI